jgi:hypothetical protein
LIDILCAIFQRILRPLTIWSAHIILYIVSPITHLNTTLSLERSCKSIEVSITNLSLTNWDQSIILRLKVYDGIWICTLIVELNNSGIAIKTINNFCQIQKRCLRLIYLLLLFLLISILFFNHFLDDALIILIVALSSLRHSLSHYFPWRNLFGSKSQITCEVDIFWIISFLKHLVRSVEILVNIVKLDLFEQQLL